MVLSLLFAWLFAASLPDTALPPAPPAAVSASVDTSAKSAQSVVVIPIHGEIDPTLQRFVERAIAEAVAQKPQRIVFDIDTWGGRLDAAFAISDTIAAIRQCSTSAFISKKAISAGALIALSTQGIYMAPGSTIGDCAPILQTNEGPQFLGEKIESPLRARFRALARRNNIPILLAEKMVTKDLEVRSARDSAGNRVWFTGQNWEALAESEKAKLKDVTIVIPDGQLLTYDNSEALEYGFSRGTFSSMQELEKAQKWTSSVQATPSWSESFVRWLSPFVPILFLVGLGALYLEYKAPGFGLFGIIGLASLGLALGSQYLVGLANYTELVLAMIGLLLIVIEVLLIPGTVILAGIGTLFLLTALVLSLQSFTLPDPNLPNQMALWRYNLVVVSGTLVGGLVAAMAIFRYVLPAMGVHQRGILTTTLADFPTAVQEPSRIGQTGVVVQALRPVGRIEIAGELLDARSTSSLLDIGTRVVVVGKDANEWIVEAQA